MDVCANPRRAKRSPTGLLRQEGFTPRKRRWTTVIMYSNIPREVADNFPGGLPALSATQSWGER